MAFWPRMLAGSCSPASCLVHSCHPPPQGMDAISGVGKLMEGFALTLDNVIGQAFEDWGPPSGGKCKPARRPTASSGSPLQARPQRAARPAPPSQPESWQDFSAPGKENAGVAVQPAAATKAPAAAGASSSGRQPHITSFMSKLDAASEQEVAEWRKRAAQLAGELQRMQAQQEEYQRLRCVGGCVLKCVGGPALARNARPAPGASSSRCPPALLPPLGPAGSSTSSCRRTRSVRPARPAGWPTRTASSSRAAACRPTPTPRWPTRWRCSRWHARWRPCCRRSPSWWRRTTDCCGRTRGCRWVLGGEGKNRRVVAEAGHPGGQGPAPNTGASPILHLRRPRPPALAAPPPPPPPCARRSCLSSRWYTRRSWRAMTSCLARRGT